MKNVLLFGSLGVFILAGGVWWSKSLEEKQPQEQVVNTDEADIVSRTGIHAHPKLQIFVNGEAVSVPPNIGVGPQYAGAPTFDVGMRMAAMHTHEGDGTIHLEYPALVTRENLKLKQFFSIWGKELMEFGDSVRMTVDGIENTELGEYEMQDGDVIVLRYEIF